MRSTVQEVALSVVRRFGGEPQLMSNGNRCPMDLMSTKMASKSGYDVMCKQRIAARY